MNSVANHYKVFNASSFSQNATFDFNQVALGEISQKKNEENIREFKIREYTDENIEVTKITRQVASDVLSSMAGSWIHIKTKNHRGVNANFTIKPGQKI
jgi:hypothetical protein